MNVYKAPLRNYNIAITVKILAFFSPLFFFKPTLLLKQLQKRKKKFLKQDLGKFSKYPRV